MILDLQVFYFTQPDTTPAKLVKDIIGRLSNTPIKNEVHRENATPDTEPAPDISTQRNVDTEESVHPVDKSSDSATYHLIPLFKPEQAELKLFRVHPAGRYAMNLTPLANGFTHQVRMKYPSTQQYIEYGLPNGEEMVKLEVHQTWDALMVHTQKLKLVFITVGV